MEKSHVLTSLIGPLGLMGLMNEFTPAIAKQKFQVNYKADEKL